MYSKSMQALGIVAALWSSTPAVLAAEKPALEAIRSAQASQVAESIDDRLIALGIAAGLVAFAFFKRKTPQIPPPTQYPSLGELPPPAKSISLPELAAAETVVMVVERPKAKPVVVELPAKKDSSADSIIGRNIVVPVDFSANTELAIRLAMVWAKPNDRVNIVYACDLENAMPPDNLTPINLVDLHPAFVSIDNETAHQWSRLPWVMVLPLAIEIVEHWATEEFAKLRQTIPIIEIESIKFQVLYGDPVSQIVSLSEDISAKLIVLVAHKHSLTDRLITGSHADKLLHASRIPVIVLCEPIKSEPSLPQEILLTTDYSPESLPVFLVLKELMQGAKPNITVLTVETAHEHHARASSVLEDLEKAFRALGLQLSAVKINAVDVEAGILDYVKRHQPQLIAMSSHGRLGFAELIHPSVTKAILHDAGIPILVVHEKATATTDTAGNLSDILRMITG